MPRGNAQVGVPIGGGGGGGQLGASTVAIEATDACSWLSAALPPLAFFLQALWQRDSVLMQLPHFTKELAAACNAKGEHISTLKYINRAVILYRNV